MLKMHCVHVLYAIFVFIICVDFSKQHDINAAVTKVSEAGNNVTLICHSNDKSHVFMAWYVPKIGLTIGPKTFLDKYKCEVVSGNLTIQNVGPKESGIYVCVSQGLDNPNVLMFRSIHLLVNQDWEEIYETDTNTNLMRASAVLGTILIILGLIYLSILFYQKYRKSYVQFDDTVEEEEDDSAEELFSRDAASTSKSHKPQDNFERVYTAITVSDKV